jgi:hypothetical protein
MSAGYRCIIIAAFGWMILCGAKPPSEHPRGNASAQQAAPAPRTATTPTPAPAASPSPAFAAYGGYDSDPCYHAKDANAADLCAYWRAAIAAEKSAHEARRATNWAIAATGISFIGVAGLIWSIWQTNGALGEARRGNRITLNIEKRARRESRRSRVDTEAALKAAQDNADAAHAGNELAREAMQRQLRPYVYLESIKPNFEILHFAEYISETANFEITIKNYGQSPAKEVKLFAVAKVGGQWDARPQADLTGNLGVHLADIPSGAPCSRDGYTATGFKAAYRGINDGVASIFVEGQIQYEDGLGTKYVTFFQRAFSGENFSSDVPKITPHWNTST